LPSVELALREAFWDGIILNRFDRFLDYRMFSPPTLGVAARGSFHLWLVNRHRKSLWKVYYNSCKFGANLGFTPGTVPC